MTSSARRAMGPEEKGQVRLLGWPIVDAVGLLVLAGFVALAFYPVYRGWYLFVAVIGFAAVGIAIAGLAAKLRWKVGTTVLAAIGGWFVFGGPLTMMSSTIGIVIPSLRTIVGLTTGPVTAWREMLTLDPPIGETFNLLTVPGMLGYLTGLIGFSIAARSSRPMLAWIPGSVAYVVAAAFGATVLVAPLYMGLAFFAAVLIWTSVRRSTVRRRLSSTSSRPRPMRLALGAGVLAVASAVGLLVAPAVAGQPERDVLRTMVEIPLDRPEHRSPLQGFRANITKHRSDTLLEVRGAREGDIVRLATMDSYDGVAYRVSTLDDDAIEETTFKRVGQWIDDDSEGERFGLSVQVHAYDGVWVPTVGRTRAVEFEGERAIELRESFFYNHASATALSTVGLQEGDYYTLSAIVPSRPSDAAIADAGAGSVRQPRIEGAPDQVRSLAQRWAEGAGTAGARALQLEKALQEGYFSHGQEDEVTSVPGHSQHRIAQLLSEPELMIGDDEQYAVAMALMARELGIPARVIYGYEAGNSPQITGEDVGAWPELNLQGLGWVRFDPTPPEDRTPEEIEPPDPPVPQPYIENPPPPPLKPDVPPPDEQMPIDTGEPPEERDSFDWGQVGRYALLIGVPLLTIVVPIALIIGLKWRRRVRRRNAADTANRVAGAWLELVDKARDLGRSPSVSATRTEQAERLAADFRALESTADPVAMAQEADWLVFAPGNPSEKVATDFWKESGQVRKGMRKSVAWPRWIVSGLSTKSFRRIK